ncbi:probable cyclic nucleotide-gated ion channel 20, chloroplastic isoform X2 [Populus nigra]|uniref:probable cyclic nucleotide-gated ion channel 20, chloroplastic isoform X2 n=1 Tax=Populus nigra TaxID=3691 RepID=UPI002B266E3C|nr:probable cyclic nucleotide-gated ion channel 20, chloroplastic isoform X2 [Populus nigra]
MANHDKDNIPTLSDTHPKSVDENVDSRFRPFLSRTQSASTSIPLDSMESYGFETNIVGFTGPLRSARKAPLVQMSGPLYINRNTENLFLAKHGVTTRKKVDSKPEKYPSLNGRDKNDWDDNYTATNAHLMRSGQLGMCNDPYCTTCPLYYHSTASQQRHAKTSSIFDSKFHSVLYGDAKGWARRFNNAINSYIPGVMNPHTKVVQEWNKFFVLSCLGAIFVDPLFFILLSVKQEEKCIVINWGMTKAVVFLRCLTDAIFLLNILLQFRLAYVAPESRVVGAGELVDHPKKIAKHYLRGFFFIDLFVVLPLPQITLFLLLLPKGLDSFGANYPKNILQAVILVQYIPSQSHWGEYHHQIHIFISLGNPGNMQNFLQALGRRRAEMSLRRRDVDKWMRHRRLPVELRRRVVEAGRYHWAATRGVNEEMLLENLPEDLQRDIRRHLFKFVKKVWIFRLMDEHVLDAVCEKLKQKIYIKGSEVFCVGGLVEKMVFIVRGKLESIGHDGTVVALSEGNVCGEELFTWFLEHSSVSKDGRKIKISGQRLISSRTVRCLTNVEAFSLSAADLEQVTSLFARNLRNPLVQGAIRYQSPYWRALAATHIQVAWRYRQKCLKHSKTSQSNHITSLSNHSSFSRV